VDESGQELTRVDESGREQTRVEEGGGNMLNVNRMIKVDEGGQRIMNDLC
jgi:hypothetical protein